MKTGESEKTLGTGAPMRPGPEGNIDPNAKGSEGCGRRRDETGGHDKNSQNFLLNKEALNKVGLRPAPDSTSSELAPNGLKEAGLTELEKGYYDWDDSKAPIFRGDYFKKRDFHRGFGNSENTGSGDFRRRCSHRRGP